MIAYYIKLDTLEYPIFLGDLYILHPEFEGAEIDASIYAPVLYSQAPTVTEFQTFDELQPECIDGVWRQVFQVRDLNAQELQEKNDWLAEAQRIDSQQGTTNETATAN